MCIHNIFLSFLLFPARHIDVLQLLEVSENMEGVSLKAGFCTSRTGMEKADLAYKIDKKVQLSVPTKQLFPGNTVTVIIYFYEYEPIFTSNLCADEVRCRRHCSIGC